MKVKFFSALAAVTALAISCEKKTYPQLEQASWLLGNWGHAIPEGRFVEQWVQENDSTYSGESFFIAVKDTSFAEYIKLIEDNGKLKYIVSVKGQNGEKPVPFTLTSASGTQLVFKNPRHDFPDTIIYKKITNDSIVAEITGLQNGRDAVEVFPMARKK
jgi:hypothetical protein